MTMLEHPRADVPHANQFFIGGEWVSPSTSDTIDVVSPFDETVAFSVGEAQAADIDRAVGAARTAFDQGPWPKMTHAERAVYLHKIADEFDRRQEQTANIWINEIGVVQANANASAQRYSSIFRYYANLAETYPFVERHQPTAGGTNGFLVREPVGVVGVIIPWNGPMAMICYKSAPALLAGCTVVLKSSPEAPGEGQVMAEICRTVGLPPGVFNAVTANREVSELLVRDPRVDKITFTGSSAAGRRIATLGGERIARVTLELGGKSAAVVLDDIDIAKAANSIADRACILSGQVCSSLTRIVVTQRRHDDLVEALSARFSKVSVGHPYDPASEMGPLAMSRQRDRVEGYIAAGLEGGARLATGGGRPSHLEQGFYVEPTVFGNVDNASKIAQEEIFGPVLSVIPARDEDDAVEIANDTVYGLNASVFTDDVDRAYAVARQIRSGTVGHNEWRTDFGIAFGGFKQSGLGREGALEGLLPFLEVKTIILDGEPTTL